ncbi:RNA polymerase sigma factor [Candidatus Parcubacteria bacterium]|nr:RNA polymerase sigma factor [Candidatus Parcubacteria bacterium]
MGTDTFTEGFERYSDELFRHCMLRLSDRERALELTQEAFLRAFEYSQKNEIRELRPFLYRTLRHLIIDEYRKHKTVSLEAMTENNSSGETDFLLPPEEGNTLEAAMARLDGAQALEMVKELPESYRDVLLFRYVEGLTPKEIAEYISESENVVSVRIHRGLKKLKSLLEEKDVTLRQAQGKLGNL